MEKFKKFLASRKDTLVLSVLASIALPLILCVAVPLEIFKNNMLEFTFSLMDFLPWCLFWFFCLASLIFVISNLLPKKPRKIVLFICLILEFLCFVQGTYLNAGIDSLRGDGIGTSLYSVFSIVVNTFIWVMFIGGFITLACLKDKKGVVRAISFILVLVVLSVQTINILFNCVTDSKIYKSNAERLGTESEVNKNITDKGLTEVASERNVYYFLVDRFDVKYAEKAYNGDNTIFDNLTGFTWFKDYMSLYSNTFPAIASMLTGVNYDLDLYDGRAEYLRESYMKEDTLLGILYKNGYDVRMYTQAYYSYYGINTLPDYIENYEVVKMKTNDKFGLALKMIQLSLFRVTPFALKNIFGNISTETLNNYFYYYTDSGTCSWDTSTKEVYDRVNSQSFEIDGDKKFTFLHFDGCHNTSYDDNWNFLGYICDESIIQYSVINSMKIIYRFLDYLKEKGLYESSTIIICGDHGAGGKSTANLFVKPSGAGSKPLKQSYAQVSQDNLWKTIFDSEGINSGLELKRGVFEIGEDEVIERNFVHHTWEEIAHVERFEYKVLGNARDDRNYTLTQRKEYKRHIMG